MQSFYFYLDIYVYALHAYCIDLCVGFCPPFLSYSHKTKKKMKRKENKLKKKERMKAADLSTYVCIKIECLCSFTRIIICCILIECVDAVWSERARAHM